MTHDMQCAKQRLRELELEHALTDEELRLVLEDPQAAVERAQQVAAAASIIAAEMMAYWTAETFVYWPPTKEGA